MFKVGDQVIVKADKPSMQVGSRRNGYIYYGSLKNRRGRVVQVNFRNACARYFSVRITDSKQPIWCTAEEIERVDLLDQLAEIE